MKEIIKVAEKLAELTKKQKKNIALGLGVPATLGSGAWSISALRNYLGAKKDYNTVMEAIRPIMEKYNGVKPKIVEWLEQNSKEHGKLVRHRLGFQEYVEGKRWYNTPEKANTSLIEKSNGAIPKGLKRVKGSLKKYNKLLSHVSGTESTEQRIQELFNRRAKVVDALGRLEAKYEDAARLLDSSEELLAHAKKKLPLPLLSTLPAIALLYYGLTNRKKKK